MHTDVLIIGAGPAGLAAAITLASEGKSVIVLEKNKQAGGQAGTTSLIENYPPFPCGVSGADLTQAACSQCEKFGVQIEYGAGAEFIYPYPGQSYRVITRAGKEYWTRSILLATGLQNRWLGVPGEDLPHVHHGMKVDALDEHCNRAVVLVGGGNSAGQAAVYYLERGADVYLMVRRPLAETMSKYLIDRIEDRVELMETEVKGVEMVEGKMCVTGSPWSVCGIDCVHIFVGQKPGTEWLSGLIDLDEKGYIKTDNQHMTSRPGLFAVGDVVSDAVRRVSCAVGYGNEVVPSIHRYLDKEA